MTQYQSVIIGCGGIGGLSDSPGDKNIISHAYAYQRHDSFELIAGCDIDQDNLNRFRSKWGETVKLYSDVNDLINTESFKVASVCSSTATHAEIINKLLAKDNIKLIICEKPIVASIGELNKLKKNLKKHSDKKLLINFPRRYDPGFIGLANRIKNNEFGSPLSFNGIFTKGLYHNGCHMLELLEFFLDDIKTVTALSNNIIENDIYGLFAIETTKCLGTIANYEPKYYSVFELDIYFEKGRLRMAEGGHRLEIHKPSESKIYPGYEEIYQNEIIEDSFYKRMYHTIEAARMYLEDDTVNGQMVFDSHLSLSEKMIILKDKFYSDIKTVTFE